jgi:hypothetical protein
MPLLYMGPKSASGWAYVATLVAAIAALSGCSWQYLDSPMSAYHDWERGSGVAGYVGLRGSHFDDKGECKYYRVWDKAGGGFLGADRELCLLDHGFRPEGGQKPTALKRSPFYSCINKKYDEYYYDSPVCYYVRNGYRWPLSELPPIRWKKPGMTAGSLLKDLERCDSSGFYELFRDRVAPDPRDRMSNAQDDTVYLYGDLCMRRKGYAIDEAGPRTLWPEQMKELFGTECPFKGACHTVTPEPPAAECYGNSAALPKCLR